MKKIIVIAVAAILLGGGYCVSAKQTETVFATVGKEDITQNDIDRFLDQLPPQYRAQLNAQMVSPEAKKELTRNIVEKLIGDKVFAREARRLKLDRKPAVQEKITAMINQILVSEYVTGLKDKIQVTEAGMQAYYEKNKAQYREPEKVKARHILLKSDEDARVVLKELKAGKDFAQLAREKSTGPSKERGGDLGWFGHGRMVPEFETAVFKMKKNDLSGIVKTKFGYHIIRLDDRKAAEQKSYEDVKSQIESQLRQQKMNAEIKKTKEKLEKKFKVKRFEETLKEAGQN